MSHGDGSLPELTIAPAGFPYDPPEVSGRLYEPRSILLLEHDSEIATPIVEQLAADGYSAVLAHTVQHATVLVRNFTPALLILGHSDRAPDPLALLREIRNDNDPWPCHLPILVLCASASPLDLLRAFSAGADDFFLWPGGQVPAAGIHYLELRARIQALLRRATHAVQPHLPRLRVGPLLIDTSSRSVLLRQQPIPLRPREYALLLHLAQQPTRVFSKPDLLRAIWGFQAPSCTRTLDSHACRLRAKLAPHAHEPWVLSVRGVGYRLID
jgi:DNA-binding response OmpR family regulator